MLPLNFCRHALHTALLLLGFALTPTIAFAPLSKVRRILPAGKTPTPPRQYISESCWIQQQPVSFSSSPTTTALGYGDSRGIDTQLVMDAWSWTANLGAPAALIAGVVLATMVDTREDMSPKKSDKPRIRLAKKLCRFLLLSSFGLELISLFVTTVTGTMLLSAGDAPVLKNMNFNSPLGFLRHNYEFEYFTARIALVQGLFHWLASVALELLIPKKNEGVAAHRMNMFIASALGTILVSMISFLNRHIIGNYPQMLLYYFSVCFTHYYWPLRPLTIVILPMTVLTIILGARAFFSSSGFENDEDDEKDKSDPGYVT